MNLFRAITITLTQCPLVYFELGRRDLLSGFNQTDQGFGLLRITSYNVCYTKLLRIHPVINGRLRS